MQAFYLDGIIVDYDQADERLGSSLSVRCHESPMAKTGVSADGRSAWTLPMP